MATSKKLPAAVLKKIDAVESMSKDLKKATLAESRDAKSMAQSVLSRVVKLRKSGTPENAVDRAIFQQINKRDAQIKRELASVLAKRKPTPLDYYRIYHKVLKESGLVSIGHLSPEIVAGIQASKCDYCAACSVCAGCAASFTVGLGLTVGVAGAAT